LAGVAETEIHLSKRFFKATEWAAARHDERSLGAPGAPSLGQVLGIASLLLEDGAGEREAIAAMVLDALADDEVPIDEIRDRFGKKVARFVIAATDARADAGRGSRRLDAETWRARRAHALTMIEEQTDEAGVLRVRAADALRDLRAFLTELRRHGSIAFARFPAPPAEHLDHYRTLVDAFSAQIPRTRLDRALRGALVEMERLVELDTATAAWRVAHVDAA
jgi:(p)ppGpp synthase/HD superfamily hydrolase